MANNYLNAVYPIQLPFGQKSVLVALANRADKLSGECFPSLRSISDDTGFARSTVITHIKKLVGDGYLSKSAQFRTDNSQRSNLYTLLVEPVKAAVKKTLKAVGKAVEMGKRFAGAADVPKPASIQLEYDNEQWFQCRADICNRAMELYPNANPMMVMDAVEDHLEYWMKAARDNRGLKLCGHQLRAKFFQRECSLLTFLNGSTVCREVLA